MSVIGEQIKKYRGIRGMTQQEIADALGESSATGFASWRLATEQPSTPTAAVAATAKSSQLHT